MSIVIRAEDINILIYKYLNEQGFRHTAYNLFYESKLEGPLREVNEDTQAGLLIHYLERGLMFNQIETHILMNEYCECKEPFSLLKPHVCQIVEKKRESKKKDDKTQDHQLIETLERTQPKQIKQGQSNYQELSNQIGKITKPMPLLDEKILNTTIPKLRINANNIGLINCNPKENQIILQFYLLILNSNLSDETLNSLVFWKKNLQQLGNQTEIQFAINKVASCQLGESNGKILLME